MILRFIALLLVQMTGFTMLYTQNADIDPRLMEEPWDARWITNIEGKYNPQAEGVFLFRKAFLLDELTGEFVVHVSADNRYVFFVNGHPVGRGPARSVPAHWNFETYDIGPFLQPGKNVLAARVWSWGKNLPWGQTSLRMGLIVQGNSSNEEIVNTGYSWRVKKDEAWEFFNYSPDEFHHTTGVGPSEKIDGSRMTDHWQMPEYDDSNWLFAEEIFAGRPASMGTKGFAWGLEPSLIPQMDTSVIRLNTVVRSSGVKAGKNFCEGNAEIIIPPHTSASILFDNQTLTVAIPEVTVEGGAGATLKMTYSEALYNNNLEKINRNTTEGMHIRGYYDIFLPDGFMRTFETLWNRTYRYLQVDITTLDQPLVIKNYQGQINLYPFELKASFESSDPYLEKILETGWRTGRTCAMENYVDCPYYEQFQYFGDLNISNLITVMLSGDARLMKSAVLQGKYSITEEGLTLAAAPGSDAKIIPFFSLAWIGMIYHYWNYSGDSEFISQLLPDIEGILDWYRSHLNKMDMLGPMPHWNFVDCTEKWPWAPEKGSVCEPTGTKEGFSSILTLQYVYGLQLAGKIFRDMGQNEKANEFENLSETIKKATFDLCWDHERKRLADIPAKTSYSQHASIFAALTGAVEGEDAKKLLRALYKDDSLLKASTQFQAYFHKALVKHGLAQEYLPYLQTWKDLIDQGFTTFPEYPRLNTRSDSHAWNAYPAYELFTVVCGINIASPGFSHVTIEPALGELKWIKAALPWKKDEIRLDLSQTRAGLKGTIYIPDGLTATYIIHGKTRTLREGINQL